MGCSTYLGLGWRYQPLAPGHPTSICDIGVNYFLQITHPLRPINNLIHFNPHPLPLSMLTLALLNVIANCVFRSMLIGGGRGRGGNK